MNWHALSGEQKLCGLGAAAALIVCVVLATSSVTAGGRQCGSLVSPRGPEVRATDAIDPTGRPSLYTLNSTEQGLVEACDDARGDRLWPWTVGAGGAALLCALSAFGGNTSRHHRVNGPAGQTGAHPQRASVSEPNLRAAPPQVEEAATGSAPSVRDESDSTYVPRPIALVAERMQAVLMAYYESRPGRAPGPALEIALRSAIPPDDYGHVAYLMLGRSDDTYGAGTGASFAQHLITSCEDFYRAAGGT